MSEEQIFHDVIALDPADRAAYLDRVCAGDPALRASVEALLRANVGASGFLAHPDPGLTVDLPSAAEGPGTRIGPYKLLQQIGEGGMGTVYMAEQTEPVRRKVALKVIKAGMDSRQVVARFEAERQALAVMDHVNIARVFDGGTTENGRPYFVMELVHGVPITKYCDDNHLTPRQRLELFVPVCQAIQHAHQKGVIHRDVKPSNVMVTLYDGKPVPKVIDFGVAKATEQRLTERTLFTQYGTMVGTLEYMSPEQAEMSALGVDTRSDIYSLGVLLYELLTGSTPLRRDRMKQAAFAEILRLIKEEEPPRPSTRLSDSGEALASISAQRQMEPAKLTRLVRGELDWIVMKCLEKDRGRRYETPSGFATDIQRYLADETVQACPPSAGYRLRKFARRNRRGLATAAVMSVAMLTVVGTLGWAIRDREANAQEAARERATRETALHAEVTTALNEAERWQDQEKWSEALSAVKRAEGLLAGGDGGELRERVRLLRKDLEMVLTVGDIPLLRSDFKGTDWDYEGADRAYAKAFADYGIDTEGSPVEEVADRLRERTGVVVALTVALDDWADARSNLKRPGGSRLIAIAQAADSDPWRRQVRVAVQQKDVQALAALAASPEFTKQSAANLLALQRGLHFAGRLETRIDVLRRAQLLYPDEFWLNYNLAYSLGVKDVSGTNREEVISFTRAALAIRPQCSAAYNLLANQLRHQGKLAEAVALYHKAIAIDPGYSKAYSNLGKAVLDQGKWDEAVAYQRKAIALNPKSANAHTALGSTLLIRLETRDESIVCLRRAIELNPNSTETYSNYALGLEAQEKSDDAIAAYHKALELDPTSTHALVNLGATLRNLKRVDEALPHLRKAAEQDPSWVAAHAELGHTLFAQRDFVGAVASYRRLVELSPKDHLPHYWLARSLAARGDLDEAAVSYRNAVELEPRFADGHNSLGNVLRRQARLEEAITHYRRAIAIEPKLAGAHCNLGQALSDQKNADAAIAAFREAIKVDPKLTAAHYRLGLALDGKGRLDDAIAAYQEVIKLDPTDAVVHNHLGAAFSTQKKLDAAVEAYRAATKLNPKSAAFRSNLGLALDAQGKSDEAVTCFREAIAHDPKYANAHSGLGRVLVKQKKTDAAVAAYRTAIELDPTSARSHRSLGDQLRLQGNPDEAIAVYREAVKLDPTSPHAYYGLGLVLSSKGLAEEATVAYHEALRLKAGADVQPLVAIELNRRAWRLATSQDPAARHPRRAVELAKEAIALKPRDQEGTYWNTLGVAHYRAGDWKDAVAALTKGMELRNGGDGTDWFFLAMAHRRLGDKDEARKWYDRAAAWTDKHQPENEELRRFRAEAAEPLGVAVEVAPPPGPKK